MSKDIFIFISKKIHKKVFVEKLTWADIAKTATTTTQEQTLRK